MQIDIKNNNTNILEYEFTLNDFAKDFFIQEKKNDFTPWTYSRMVYTQYKTYVDYLESKNWLGTVSMKNFQTIGENASRYWRGTNLWIYRLPIIKIDKNVDNPSDYKYITIVCDYSKTLSNTHLYSGNLFANNINTTLNKASFYISNNNDITEKDIDSNIYWNNQISSNPYRYTTPYGINYPDTSFSSNLVVTNVFAPPTNILKNAYNMPNNISRILPYHLKNNQTLYIQLAPYLNEIYNALLSFKQSIIVTGLTTYSGDTIVARNNYNFIYNQNSNNLIGFSLNDYELYYNNTTSKTIQSSTFMKSSFENILGILNTKVIVYLSKEPIY